MKSLTPYDLPKISIKNLTKQIEAEVKQALLKAKLTVDQTPIDLTTTTTSFNGLRYWLKCPNCARPVQSLYSTPTSNKPICRLCAGLKYRYK